MFHSDMQYCHQAFNNIPVSLCSRLRRFDDGTAQIQQIDVLVSTILHPKATDLCYNRDNTWSKTDNTT
jgi:hypothetical protein